MKRCVVIEDKLDHDCVHAGYYGFPNSEFYPCDSSGCGYQSKSGPQFRLQNDKLQPLWEAVDVLLPSVYMQYLCPSAHCPASWNTTKQANWNSLINARMINGTVEEAVRLQQSTKRKPPVYAYIWAYVSACFDLNVCFRRLPYL